MTRPLSLPRGLAGSSFIICWPIVLSFPLATLASGARDFVRGDSNADGAIDLSDGVHLLTFLFRGGSAPTCEDAADANDDGRVDVSDAIRILLLLFRGNPPPPPPTPRTALYSSEDCGPDPTDDARSCTSFPPCPPPDKLPPDITINSPEERLRRRRRTR